MRWVLLCVILAVFSAYAREPDSTDDSLSRGTEVQPPMLRKQPAMHDPWFSQDKFLHFSASAALTGFSYYVLVCRFDREQDESRVFSVSVTALIGIVKELADKKTKGHFSWKDLVWDGVGITAGYVLFMNQ